MSVIENSIELLKQYPALKTLMELPEKVEQLEKRIADLETQISGTGDVCPYCRKPKGQLLDIVPDPLFGDLGKHIEKYKCSNCQREYTKSRKI